MWNRDEREKRNTQPALPTAALEERRATGWLSKGVTIKGEVIASEDLNIDGRVEGRIEVRGHCLLIGPNATVQAQVVARTVTIMGAVTGDITASDKVDIRKAGSVDGDIDAPKVAMADGAQLRGRIDTLSATKGQRKPLSVAV